MPVGANEFRFGPFQLDTQCGQLRKNGIGLKLQGQPVQILEVLVEKSGELVTREELRGRLWSPGTFVEFEHSLNAAIQRLRQASSSASSPDIGETDKLDGQNIYFKEYRPKIRTKAHLPSQPSKEVLR